MTFEWYHFILLIFVYFHIKNQDPYVNTSDKIVEHLPKIENTYGTLLFIVPILLALPNMNHNFLETYLGYISIILAFRCVQSKLDVNNHVNIMVPSLLLFCILAIQKVIVPRAHVSTVYIYVLIFSGLQILNRKTSTLQLTNDIVIVHFLFYMLKYV